MERPYIANYGKIIKEEVIYNDTNITVGTKETYNVEPGDPDDFKSLMGALDDTAYTDTVETSDPDNFSHEETRFTKADEAGDPDDFISAKSLCLDGTRETKMIEPNDPDDFMSV